MTLYTKCYLKINVFFSLFFIDSFIQIGFAQKGPDNPIPSLTNIRWYADRLEVSFPIEKQMLYTFKDFKKIKRNNLIIKDSVETYFFNWTDASRGTDIRIRIWQHPNDTREYRYLKEDSAPDDLWFVIYSGFARKKEDEKLILKRKSNGSH